MDAPVAFDFAKDLTLQLITLSTAVVGVSATFSKDISASVDKRTRNQLYYSWFCFLLSIVAGLFTLGAMTGVLANAADISKASVYSSNITALSMVQWILFLGGVLLLILHAMRSAPAKD